MQAQTCSALALCLQIRTLAMTDRDSVRGTPPTRSQRQQIAPQASRWSDACAVAVGADRHAVLHELSLHSAGIG